MKRISLAFVLAVLVFGCTSKKRKAGYIGKLYVSDTAETQKGITLWLYLSHTKKTDTTTCYFAEALCYNKILGFEVDVPNKAQTNRGYGDGVCFKSMGPKSDFFLKQLAGFCKIKISRNAKFVKSYKVSYLNLNQFIKSVSKMSFGGSNTKNLTLYFTETSVNRRDASSLMIAEDRGQIGFSIRKYEFKQLVIDSLTQK